MPEERGERREGGIVKGMREPLRVMDMLTVSRAVMASRVCTNVKIHHPVYFNYVKFIWCPLYLYKSIKHKKCSLSYAVENHLTKWTSFLLLNT